MLSAKTKINLIIGDPVEHSLSPVLHNTCYKVQGIGDKYVYLACRVKKENLQKAVEGARALGINGLTCTIPHKVEVMKFLDELDETAKKIGAVNTVVNKKGRLIGYNTDWYGVEKPLFEKTSLEGKKVAVLGAGGAARAVCYVLEKHSAKAVVFNRTLEKAKKLAEDFGFEYRSLEESDIIARFDVIINATSVGMHPLEDQSIVKESIIRPDQVFFDVVYIPYKTKLLRLAEEKGAVIIPGVEMLLYQAVLQYELYTGQKPPVEVMRKVLYKSLGIND